MADEIHTYVYEVKLVAKITVRASDAGRAEAKVARAIQALGVLSISQTDGTEIAITDDDEGGPFLAEYDGETA